MMAMLVGTLQYIIPSMLYARRSQWLDELDLSPSLIVLKDHTSKIKRAELVALVADQVRTVIYKITQNASPELPDNVGQ